MRFPFALVLLAGVAWPTPKVVSLRVVPAEAALQGARASQQFLAIAKYEDGAERDVTAEVEWRLSKPALAKFLSPARIAPLADGKLTVIAILSGREAASTLKIADATAAQPVSFRREIAGILTKRGCNSAILPRRRQRTGRLHTFRRRPLPGRRLRMDHQGRRLSGSNHGSEGRAHSPHQPGDPAKSLLLLKPTGAIAHGGGKRFESDSEDYRTILEWVRNKAPYSTGGAERTNYSIRPITARHARNPRLRSPATLLPI